MRGRASEIVETISRRKISLCAIQKSRWKGCSARMITGKDSKYKFLWSGDESGLGGVGVLVKEALVENAVSVERINNRIMHIRIMINKITRINAKHPILKEEERVTSVLKYLKENNKINESLYMTISNQSVANLLGYIDLQKFTKRIHQSVLSFRCPAHLITKLVAR